jgi:diguanylate cyclase (GGDEF)-like protein
MERAFPPGPSFIARLKEPRAKTDSQHVSIGAVTSRIVARNAPFAGAAVLAFALVPIGSDVDWPLYVVAAVLTALVIAAGLQTRWSPRGASLGAALLFLLATALLRHAAGGNGAGVGVLPLLPLFWMALHGSRRDVMLLLAVTGLYWLVPVLLLGGPQYPGYTLRTGALMVVTSGIVGLTVHRLVAAGRAREAELHRLVAERQELMGRLEGLATTDPLTGAGNRRAWDSWLEEALASSARTGDPVCVAMLDLDHFKAFNDQFGHQRGDELLRVAADRWTGELRNGDRLARYGGEEFLVLLPRCDADDAVHVLDRMRALTPDGQTCSAGVALWDGIERADELLARVDAALYAAKTAGRNRTARSRAEARRVSSPA